MSNPQLRTVEVRRQCELAKRIHAVVEPSRTRKKLKTPFCGLIHGILPWIMAPFTSTITPEERMELLTSARTVFRNVRDDCAGFQGKTVQGH